MASIENFVRHWSRTLALPKPRVKRSQMFHHSFYSSSQNHTIHVRWLIPAKAQMSLAFHEIGHFFLQIHFGTIVPKKQFIKLFGDRYQAYESLLIGTPGMRLFPPTCEGYMTLYAQAHPEEDWAETFAAVLMAIQHSKKMPYTFDQTLNEKIRFVEKAVRKAIKKGAA